MKLITKTSLFYLVFGIPVLILAGYICFAIATEEIEEGNDGILLNLREQVTVMISNRDFISLNTLIKSNEISLSVVADDTPVSTTFSDTLLLDKREQEYSEARMLTTILKRGNKKFKVKIWRNSLESDQLIGGIFTSMVAVLILLVLIYVIINVYVSRKLWKPFYKALDNLKKFQGSDNSVPEFVPTNIKEFDELNTSLKAMMGNMILDYGRQKKFTEHTSHEIQTPLAVIKSKVDLLIQSELSAHDAKLIVAIDDACSRLIRINRSLLLLTKIENRQFKTTEKVSFAKKINNSLALFADHIANKNIIVQKSFDGDFVINANPDLCLILVNNLLQNAIRHNFNGGSIIFVMTHDRLSIMNSGKADSLNGPQLYQRFHKNSEVNDSVGLGLAIAKEIADASQLTLSYEHREHIHIFSVSQNSDEKLKNTRFIA